MTLMSRMIFGCGRLTGGASEREAIGLVQLCLDAGIRHFDTAPSYGLGTAEAVIGKTTRGRGDILITAKVGSSRPSSRTMKTYLRRAKRLLQPQARQSLAGWSPPPPQAQSSISDFSPAAMARSLQISRAELNRDRLDYLLLHEAFADDFNDEVADQLARFQADGVASAIGYSNGAVFDDSTDSRFPPTYVAQTAIRPEYLLATCSPPASRALFLHSLVKTGDFLQRTNPVFSASLDQAVRLIAVDACSAECRRIALVFALAAERLPGTKLIFSSANPNRLQEVLNAIAFVDQNRLTQAIASEF
jgi:diketogulonate reductase-like aldo/keto reductase